MSEAAFDPARSAKFLTTVMEHNAAAMTVLMGSFGERLGLFKALAEHGPATSEELAEHARIHERYVREWLAGMHASGYLEHESDSGRYVLPREHRPVLIKEGHPFFQAHFLEQITGLYAAFEQVTLAAPAGDGVDQSRYSEHFFVGLERATRIWVERSLVPYWIAQLPDVQQKLEAGGSVAELGCGSGLALIKLAEAFPKSTAVGFDIDPRSIERATRAAAAAGVQDRLRFEVRDLSEGLPESYDLITCFDMLHDVPDPLAVLRAARGALSAEGTFLVGEWAVEDEPDGDANPLAALMYGFSVMYCVPATLAQGGEALGTLGLPESKLRALAEKAGLGEVRLLTSGHPVLSLYAIRPA